MPLTTDITLRLLATLTKAADIGSTPMAQVDFSQRIKLATGTGAGKADKLFYDARQIAASSSEDLDLVGALTDQFGDSFNPVRIKAIAILADVDNSNNVVVGGAAATAWSALLGTTGTVTLRPGAFFCAAAGAADATGYVCAAGATDLLKVANSGAGSTVDYSIVVVGVSA